MHDTDIQETSEIGLAGSERERDIYIYIHTVHICISDYVCM